MVKVRPGWLQAVREVRELLEGEGFAADGLGEAGGGDGRADGLLVKAEASGVGEGVDERLAALFEGGADDVKEQLFVLHGDRRFFERKWN